MEEDHFKPAADIVPAVLARMGIPLLNRQVTEGPAVTAPEPLEVEARERFVSVISEPNDQ